MKNLMFLFIGIFCLGFISSCGEENFDPYKDEGYDKAKGLLPVEIVEKMELSGGLPPIVTTTVFEYDEDDRLINSRVTSGKFVYVQNISYNESDGKVKSVKISHQTENFVYTYNYPDENTIIENKALNGKDVGTSVLIFKFGSLFLKENHTDGITTNYLFDARGNVITEGENMYSYDGTKGILSAVKTPRWLFFSLQGQLPYSYNIINNVIIDEENYTYDYVEYNHSQYPTKVNINGGESTLTIKYKLSNKF